MFIVTYNRIYAVYLQDGTIDGYASRTIQKMFIVTYNRIYAVYLQDGTIDG